jgi:hypothetical protein
LIPRFVIGQFHTGSPVWALIAYTAPSAPPTMITRMPLIVAAIGVG